MRYSLPFFASLVAAAPKPSQRESLAPAFFLAGDSTTAIQSENGGGWGTGFLSTLTNSAKGTNFGVNGATTVSYLAEGHWSSVLAELSSNADTFDCYVTIQVRFSKALQPT